MRIFVSEFVCCGAWPQSEVPTGLLAEGRAMLVSVMSDLARLSDAEVLTTWDRRIPQPEWVGNIRARVVENPTEELIQFQRLAAEADQALIIAPEFEGILENRCRTALAVGGRLLNCDPETIHRCADKFETFEICRDQGLPTIPTRLPENSVPWLPCVVKLRDGAGSSEMLLIRSAEDWNRWQSTVDVNRFIVQPWIEGDSLSASAIFDRGHLRALFPVTAQHLTPGEEFRYCGGCIPARGDVLDQAQSLVMALAAHLPGLHGYVGFDFLLAEHSGELLLVEVNPRLCTSYVGYRQLTADNLGEWLSDPGRRGLPSFQGTVRFLADGTIQECSR